MNLDLVARHLDATNNPREVRSLLALAIPKRIHHGSHADQKFSLGGGDILSPPYPPPFYK